MVKLYKQENEYILSAIDASGYDVPEPTTNKEKVQFLYDTFHSEYAFMIERVGEYKALQEWLMGLPSSMNIEFVNYNILQLAKKWGSLPENATEKQEEKILSNYWPFMAMRIMGLFRKYLKEKLNKTTDISYRHLGMFTLFMPESPEGETAWNELAEYTEDTGKVLRIHAKSTIDQLKRAGYTVKKAAKVKPPTAQEMREIFKEMEECGI